MAVRKRTRKKKATKKRYVVRCTTRRSKKTGRKVKVCRRVLVKPKPKRKRTPAAPAVAYRPTPLPAAPQPLPTPPPAAPQPPADPGPAPPTPPVQASFGAAQAERLLWRAGFGPRPGDVARFAAMGLDGAVDHLLSPPAWVPDGPAPVDENGNALAPYDLWGHDHCTWLDIMVRSNQPLVDRMALVWHDWFATSADKVQVNHMIGQFWLLRRNALGNFGTLLREISVGPAMLDWLDGIRNTRWNPNENFAREVMELFTLGANRGAYTEDDVRNAARALTGWRADWVDGAGYVNFRLDPGRHDTASKTIFGQTGPWNTGDVLRMCLEHPMHPSFAVTKLWGMFVGEPADAATQALLQDLYVASGREIKPLLRAILRHPRFYEGPAMVKPPIVYLAGLLRAVGRGVDTTAWAWLCESAGQVLYRPPNVSGWDDARWLDTSTWTGRWALAAEVLERSQANVWSGTPYDATEDPATAVDRALAHLGRPGLTSETLDGLRSFAQTCLPATLASWAQSPYRAMRQNALRMLIATSSDLQVS